MCVRERTLKRCDSEAAAKKAARRKGAVSLSRNPPPSILSAFVAGHLMGGLGLMSTSAARRSFTITINTAALQKQQSSRLALSVSSNDQGRLTKLKEAQLLHFKRGGTGDKRGGDNNVDIPDMYPLVLHPGEDAAWWLRSCF